MVAGEHQPPFSVLTLWAFFVRPVQRRNDMAEFKGKCYRCTACGENYVGSLALQTCQACQKIECHECVTKEGACAPCGELTP